MKTKLLVVTAALVGAATLSAHAGVRFGFSIGLPLPPIPVVRVAAVAPAPVVVTPPVIVATPPCPVPGYVWVPGYWSGHVWIGGCWHLGPAHFAYAHPYGHYYGGHRW